MQLDFNPQRGHEQANRRPAVVLSPKTYNEKSGLALFCPVTSQVKGYPFEVAIPEGLKVSGVALSDQIKSQDWRARGAKFMDTLPPPVMDEITAKVKTLLEG